MRASGVGAAAAMLAWASIAASQEPAPAPNAAAPKAAAQKPAESKPPAQKPSPPAPKSAVPAEKPDAPAAQGAAGAAGADEARGVLERALVYLVNEQHEDGSWASPVMESVQEFQYSVESFYAWQMAAGALACMALMECDENPARRAALEQGLHWLCRARLPRRGNDWDVDYQWTGLYGTVATVRAAEDPRFQSPEWQKEIAERGQAFVRQLEENQVPEGGWGYYDNGVYTERPKMHTSFSTACVLPALARAYARGWGSDPKVLDRARNYVESCALPNGAWAYGWDAVPRPGGESINQVKGSLGRIQVCHWALASIGVKKITTDRIREGLDRFFEHHRFLDIARMRPVPHEAYYANASYFYFFAHYYAAQAIRLLPPEQRADYYAKLRPHLAKVQNDDGSFVDTPNSHYFWIADTAFAALALDLSLGG